MNLPKFFDQAIGTGSKIETKTTHYSWVGTLIAINLLIKILFKDTN